MCETHRKLRERSLEPGALIRVQVNPYQGSNRHIYKMTAFLARHLDNDLVGAYVHGSLGTYEDVSYSDFDALAILKNDVFLSTGRLIRVASRLQKARSIMFDFDPLQHHGWFVLTEAHLNCYPAWYFPVELFDYAKSLFIEQGMELTIKLNPSRKEEREIFTRYSDKILKKIKKYPHPKNLYQLKSLLSGFMLLPALYVQARDGKGVFKKYSFDAAKSDFINEEWAIMDEVSLIRKNWCYRMSSAKRWLFANAHPFARYLSQGYAPSIPLNIRQHMSEDFYARMIRLILSMRNKICLN
jgi:hypothetical protein